MTSKHSRFSIVTIPVGAQLDFADLGRVAGDADQAVEEPVGIFCALSVIR